MLNKKNDFKLNSINNKYNSIDFFNKYFGSYATCMPDAFLDISFGKQFSKMHMLVVQEIRYINIININSLQPRMNICGYGESFYKSLLKLIGESIERYSFLIKTNISSKDVKFSLNKKNGKTYLNDKYIYIYPQENNSNNFTKLSKLPWVKINAFINGKISKIFVPDFIIGPSTNNILKFPIYTTGTATHTSKKTAIYKSICEAVQIDEFMKFWYLSKSDFYQIKIDKNFKKTFFKNLDESKWETFFVWNFSKKFKIHTVICVLISKNFHFPKYIYGIQGGSDINYCIRRSMEEAVASMSICIDVYKIEKLKNNKNKFQKLDLNVIEYAIDKNNIMKNRINIYKKMKKINISKIKKYKKFKQIEIIKNFIKSAKICSFFDITADEFKGDFFVIRLFCPELIPMFPYKHPPIFHKSFIKNKNNILNSNFHPLP